MTAALLLLAAYLTGAMCLALLIGGMVSLADAHDEATRLATRRAGRAARADVAPVTPPRACCNPLHARRDGIHVALHTCIHRYGQPWQVLEIVRPARKDGAA